MSPKEIESLLHTFTIGLGILLAASSIGPL